MRQDDLPNPGIDIQNEEQAYYFLATNPHLGNVFKCMIKEGIAEETAKITTLQAGKGLVNKRRQNDENTRNENQDMRNCNKVPDVNNKAVQQTRAQAIKSPSDTTIYAPALKKLPSRNDSDANDIIQRISNFVEEIRIGSNASTPKPGTSGQKQHPQQGEEDDGPVEGRTDKRTRQAEQFVIDAEKFYAAVEAPRGKITQTVNNLVERDYLIVDDDEYFHLACHVDSGLKKKIELGKFIELERLLPKRRSTCDEGRLEWVTKDGLTFLAPIQDGRDQKITNVRHWDQAFRVYAAIYCKANPGRAGEIWQYIYMINSAASTYQWDNVAYYDYTFRQLMAERHQCSWSKTYIQLWQLALRDTIPKNNNNNWTGNGPSTSQHATANNPNESHKTWRDRCCWKFNQFGKCNRMTCSFDNRCSYCWAWNHGSNTCRKKKESNGNGHGKGCGGSGAHHDKK